MWVPAGRFRLQIIRVNRSDLYRIHNADHGVMLRGCYGTLFAAHMPLYQLHKDKELCSLLNCYKCIDRCHCCK